MKFDKSTKQFSFEAGGGLARAFKSLGDKPCKIVCIGGMYR